MTPRILVVLIEYDKKQSRVSVRGVWEDEKLKQLKPFEEGNCQHYVRVFEGVDMGAHVGFANLMPKEEES